MKLQKQVIGFMLTIGIFVCSCSKDPRAIFVPPPPVVPLPLPPVTPTTNTQTAQLIQVGQLSQARTQIAAASAGGKIVFAGGEISPNTPSSRVDIFDIATNTWSTTELSQARSKIATAVVNNKIYFAGGSRINSFSSRVDIYNTITNEWSTANLTGVEAIMSGVATATKVVFASGVIANIYDVASNSWSTAPLSERPGSWGPAVMGIAATVIGNNMYFAGGTDGMDVQRAIDIFDTNTNTWSTSTLSEYKGGAAGIAIGNINIWAGGFTYPDAISSRVEIRDMVSGAITYGSLFQGNAFFSAVQKNDAVVFFTGSGSEKSKFDIYHLNTRSWSIGLLTDNIEQAAIISVNNNTVWIAGGKINGVVTDQVRRLEF